MSITKTKAKPVNYLSNERLKIMLAESNQQNQPTKELADAFLLLTKKYAQRPNFIGYYNIIDDMKGEALLQLCRAWKSCKFDNFINDRGEAIIPNPFAYFTQIVHNSFIQVLRKEKTCQIIRDELRISVGELPSENYEANMENRRKEDVINKEKAKKSKMSKTMVRDIRTMGETETAREISKRLDYTERVIQNIISRRSRHDVR